MKSDTPKIDLAGVAVFLQTAAAGNLSAAARRLGIPPLAAARRLASLENGLGVRLMHRTTRSVSLTTEGEAFLPFATTIQEAAEAGIAEIRPSVCGATGTLRVTACGSMGRAVLMPTLTELMRSNPDLRVDLVLTDAVLDLAATGVDVAVRIGDLRDSNLVATSLGTKRRILCAAPSYLASRPAPRRLSDLAGHECITPPDAQQWSFTVGAQERTVRAGGRLTVSSFEGVHDACIAGAGIAMLSSWYTRGHLAAGQLVSVELEDARPKELAVWAVYPTRRQLLPKVRVFVDAMREALSLDDSGLTEAA